MGFLSKRLIHFFAISMLHPVNCLRCIDVILFNIVLTSGKSCRTHLVPVVHIGMLTFFSYAPFETVL